MPDAASLHNGNESLDDSREYDRATGGVTHRSEGTRRACERASAWTTIEVISLIVLFLVLAGTGLLLRARLGFAH